MGVDARWSAARSASVKSVSCPTALIVGKGEAAIALTTTSSLNAQRSSTDPPPLPTMTRSKPPAEASTSIACAISPAAPSPCTIAGASVIPIGGHLRRAMRIMSRSAAPCLEVTIPMRDGNRGRGLFLAGSNSPSADSRSFLFSSSSKRDPSPRTSTDWAYS